MSRLRLTAVGEFVASLLSKDVLTPLGITVGEEVEVSALVGPGVLEGTVIYPLAKSSVALKFYY